MRSLFAALLILVASAVQAQNTLPIPSPGLGLSGNVMSRLSQTILRMNDNVEESDCTVFPVSRDGYLLTALHCLRNCLLSQGLAEQGSNSFVDLQDLLVIRSQSQRQVTCPNLSIDSLNIKGVQVIATGPALSIYGPKFLNVYSGLFAELAAKGWQSKANDFALLKVPVARPLACLKLQTTAVGGGQPLWAVGYPVSKTQKQNPPLSASPGRVYAQVEESAIYKSQVTAGGQYWVRTQFGERGLLFSNASVHFGQSGGPSVDASGAVLGVTSGFMTTEGAGGSEIHELVSTSIPTVLSRLPPNLAKDLVQMNQQCE